MEKLIDPFAYSAIVIFAFSAGYIEATLFHIKKRFLTEDQLKSYDDIVSPFALKHPLAVRKQYLFMLKALSEGDADQVKFLKAHLMISYRLFLFSLGVFVFVFIFMLSMGR